MTRPASVIHLLHGLGPRCGRYSGRNRMRCSAQAEKVTCAMCLKIIATDGHIAAMQSKKS
ncbi:MAG: hypothetical protein IPL99_12475 [Candidatus Competibacteraceae bacterium]|nr:hypothetical protein [Candidatus Competibacteraceae bacterium]